MLRLGRYILRARQYAGYTQKQLAEKIGVTKTYISHLENERSEPSIALLRDVTKVTHTRLEIKICF